MIQIYVESASVWEGDNFLKNTNYNHDAVVCDVLLPLLTHDDHDHYHHDPDDDHDHTMIIMTILEEAQTRRLACRALIHQLLPRQADSYHHHLIGILVVIIIGIIGIIGIIFI